MTALNYLLKVILNWAVQSDKLIIPGKAEINGNGANVMINNLTSTHANITLKNSTADKNLSWKFNSTG